MTVKKIKNCSKCGTEYPATSEYFRKSAICVDGISNVCKKCAAILKKEWRKNTGRYKKGPRQNISFQKRYQNDSILRRAMILRQGIIKRSKDKNLPCDKELLTVSYFVEALKKNSICECCGREMDFTFKNNVNDRSPTVDRIVPSLGYVNNNIAIICWRCNAIKKDADLAELKNLLNWMLHYE
jgi:hypothetical protein